jgi:hypothetical protein
MFTPFLQARPPLVYLPQYMSPPEILLLRAVPLHCAHIVYFGQPRFYIGRDTPTRACQLHVHKK